jgi:hypothetical protein
MSRFDQYRWAWEKEKDAHPEEFCIKSFFTYQRRLHSKARRLPKVREPDSDCLAAKQCLGNCCFTRNPELKYLDC